MTTYVSALVSLVCLAVIVVTVVNAQGKRGHSLTDQTTPLVVLAVIALLGLVVFVAARSRSSEVTIDPLGIMTMFLHGSRHQFDLNSPSLALEMTGRPGERGWQLIILRRSMSPLTVDRRNVDPKAFMTVLRQWRSEV